MSIWKRNEQETTGNYFFNGTFYCTQKVHLKLPVIEIIFLYLDVRKFAKENNGIDYLQVYKDEQGRTLYFIDNVSKEQLLSGEFDEEDNYCTLLFSEEY